MGFFSNLNWFFAGFLKHQWYRSCWKLGFSHVVSKVGLKWLQVECRITTLKVPQKPLQNPQFAHYFVCFTVQMWIMDIPNKRYNSPPPTSIDLQKQRQLHVFTPGKLQKKSALLTPFLFNGWWFALIVTPHEMLTFPFRHRELPSSLNPDSDSNISVLGLLAAQRFDQPT